MYSQQQQPTLSDRI
uniref:Uncharacterized protein n=1 Tax=Rhizophora mucronata TaxID=61149 RepID=A0A2P2JMX0_RHIMU